ncbi:ComEA family DNA-binding protein [Microvirga mediterraneensis]|uniref:Helix-hairpin-helix domain-containing protein n=1 Tax=Microvirga mediterraneensis TaxID=2754695 RepID=A0A838BMQ6_9HYPH|nr:helix-hairpin-helix domain-containing protein [Microvirga mediterraneensis]MBA1156243.1 helix-hairpin-helix domain-containing protein [Microvirga mediterraneensis]
MHVGDLSRTRTPSEPHDNVARLATRVLLVVGLMSAGWLALWRFQDSGPVTEGMVAAAPPQTITVETKPPAPPDRAAPLQVADADPVAPIALPVKPQTAASPQETDEEDWGQSFAEPAIDVVAIGQSSNQSLAMLKQFEAVIGQASRKEALKPQPTPRADMNMTGTVTQQAGLADPSTPAGGPPPELVDLNKSTIEDLNSLKGAGSLGRAIVRGRPYKSVEDLVNKRVVRRATYERIKDQLTVQ